MASMLDTIWLVITALAFGGVIEKAGMLDRLIAPIIKAAKSTGALVASLVSAVLATSILTADKSMAVVLPGRMFKKAFVERGLAPVTLSRSVGAAATPTSALIPWNSCGAYMSATLGVATLSSAPYAVFNIARPLLTIAFACGFSNAGRPSAPRGVAGACKEMIAKFQRFLALFRSQELS